MEFKTMESVIMTGTELSEMLSDYLKNRYGVDRKYAVIIVSGVNGSVNYLDDNLRIIFKTEQV